jgi:hypothetical protein
MVRTVQGRSEFTVKMTTACLLTGTRYAPLLQAANLASLRLPSAQVFESYSDSVKTTNLKGADSGTLYRSRRLLFVHMRANKKDYSSTTRSIDALKLAQA